MNQIVTMQLEMNISEITEEREIDVIDPQYVERVQGYPISEIDWEKDEED